MTYYKIIKLINMKLNNIIQDMINFIQVILIYNFYENVKR